MVGAKKVRTLVPCNLIQGVLVFEIRELIFGDFWKGFGFYHLQSNYARCYYDKKLCLKIKSAQKKDELCLLYIKIFKVVSNKYHEKCETTYLEKYENNTKINELTCLSRIVVFEKICLQ